MTDSRIEIHAGDITKLEVDAIVNAANTRLAPGSGVCGAIHQAAGLELARACGVIRECPTGEARITPGFDLPAKFVIHAVGPIWRGGEGKETIQLADCYRNSLDLAKENGCTSIAFPAISTGVYGFPLEQATDIAVSEVDNWLSCEATLERVVFTVFGEEAEAVYKARLAL